MPSPDAPVVPVGGREGRTRGDEVEWQPVGWMLAVQGCLGHAGDALGRGGLQVVLCKMGQGRVGRAGEGGQGKGRHCIEDESSNNGSRIVGQTQPTPFPLCIPRHHLPAAQPNNCPSLVPTPWIVYRFRQFSHPLCQALTGQLWPQSGHSFSG